MNRSLRRLTLSLSLLIVTLYLPTAVMIYTPYWYQINCQWHGRCEQLGVEKSQRAIDNLGQFFRHQRTLNPEWSLKERLHLREVRPLFDSLSALLLLALIGLLLLSERQALHCAARTNLMILCSLLLLLPAFDTIWRDLIHEQLFSNRFWLNTPDDLSWYLMPRTLFRNGFILLLGSGLLLNLGLLYGLRPRPSISL